MWRRRVKPRAVAEDDIQLELQDRGLANLLRTNVGIRFTSEEVKKYRVHGTNVDGIYGHPFMVIYFLDGQPHLGNKQSWKDQQIDKVLRKRGFTVLRFSYIAPMRKGRKAEIITEIVKALNCKEQ
ncbi:MAG: DUF559 domain-containing protein [Candidatus Bathyarchaeota archaeon]|nr:MAG: DUF559 domain-containing protein [Candidatus Bathyarchaeota archaeon]